MGAVFGGGGPWPDPAFRAELRAGFAVRDTRAHVLVTGITSDARPPWRDYSNVRGPQPMVYRRRGVIRDVVFPADWRFPWGSGVGLGWGPTYATCAHGKTWPEGDYIAPRGRACGRCVSEAHGDA